MDFLRRRLDRAVRTGGYRTLPGTPQGIDFWSNDYLGFARRGWPTIPEGRVGGSGGSRLISGDSSLAGATEQRIADYHGYPAALTFHSGYAALQGLVSTVARRGDVILYDELIHACCHDGMRLSRADCFRFAHNDMEDLERRLAGVRTEGNAFVLTEARFSMDGDEAPLEYLIEYCRGAGAHLIVDEAHSFGTLGSGGRGLVAAGGYQSDVFATVVTYGKAGGYHGAAVLGSTTLREYLVNFCRPFIFTTAPGAGFYHTLNALYDRLSTESRTAVAELENVRKYWTKATAAAGLEDLVIPWNFGPIQIIKIAGNERVMRVESACRTAGYLVKGIRAPTVRAGRERLRICLHSFNTEAEVDGLVSTLTTVLR